MLHKDFIDEIYKHHRGLLMNARMIVSDNNSSGIEAEDLLQMAYEKAFRKFHLYKRGTNGKAWTSKIMQNIFLNEIRKKQFLKSDNVDINNLDIEYEMEFANLDMMLLHEMDDELYVAFKSLNALQRNIMILNYIEEWSYHDIAKFYNIPVGTIRSRLHRGKEILKRKLKNYYC